MNPNKAGKFENIVDVLLGMIFLVVGILIIGSIVLAPYCGGWNEGSMQGACNPSSLNELYNSVSNYGLLVAITAIIWLPLALLAVVLSIVTKVIRYVRGFRPQSVLAVLIEITRLIPIITIASAAVYLLYLR